MPRDIIGDKKVPYKNWEGKTVEFTHVEVTYYVPTDDNKRVIVLPIDMANEFANKEGIRGPYVSAGIMREEAIERGYFDKD